MNKKTIQYLTELEYDQTRLRSMVETDLISCEEFKQRLDATITAAYLHFSANEYDMYFPIEMLIGRMITMLAVQPKGMTLSNLIGSCRHSDEAKEIVLIGELVSVMADCDLINAKVHSHGFADIYPVFVCEDYIVEDYHAKGRLPPMIVKPRELKTNTCSPLLSGKKKSLILKGKYKHHDGDIALDVINKFNSIPFSLDTDALIGYSAEHEHILNHGNVFHLLHNPDNRGRFYANGYETDYQGDDYNKSIVEFTEHENIEGF